MAAAAVLSEKSWVGTNMKNLYYGHGPWGFEIEPIIPSKNHTVLYQLPVTLKSPPEPYFQPRTHDINEDHVRMPFSPGNLYTIKNENEEKIVKERWEVIKTSLSQPINSSKELESAINKYCGRLPEFLALHNFFENVLEREESKQFFESLLPGIINLALQLPEILPGNVPLLNQGICKSVSLSQLQIASLLANAFLCTFKSHKDKGFYPRINFVWLYAVHNRPKREQAVAEKLKCVLHYFRRVLAAKPLGVVTFERKYAPTSQLPKWDHCDNNLGNTRIHVSSTGLIENDADGLLQADFANKNVGGAVIDSGCVQEEIRFIICPELIISRLFTEQLAPTEALLVIGAECYSSYTGYGDNFLWGGDYQDSTPYDDFGRRHTSIVAIDALRFTKPIAQYNPINILRELNKAYAGFHSNFKGQLPAVATGNWGCGAYRGNPSLKFLIQLMACSATKRDMVYFTFGEEELQKNIHEFYLFLVTNHITIAQLWSYLCMFADDNVKPKYLYSYIQQAHTESKIPLSSKEISYSSDTKFRKKRFLKSSKPPSIKNPNPDVVDAINFDNEDIGGNILNLFDIEDEDSDKTVKAKDI